ncbi:gamma-butyrobetaine dioxygenase-like [Antedon mediterranea]|uniref:gamma-butyrobetaine dioxygenase-like n=1 Tax=Antedon mediterranea TaxID=105859 RepID=UPI003AF78772
MLRGLQRISIYNILRWRAAPLVLTNPNRIRIDISSNSRYLKQLYSSVNNNLRNSVTTTDQAKLKIDLNSETIKLVFDEVSVVQCPFVWLRDNCHCSSCYELSSGQKQNLLENLDLDIHPLNATIKDQSVIVNWSDKHVSEYPLSWLRDVKFPAATDPEDERRYWGSEMTKSKVSTFSYNDIMSDKSSLHSWLLSLHTDGITIVNDLGSDDKNLVRLANMVTHPRTTCHGVDFGIKPNTLDPTNLGYTGNRLGLHTDLVYYSFVPGVLVLHCITMSEDGGLSEFADGFKVAYDLQKEDPETFDVLSRVPLAYLDDGVHGMSKTNYILMHQKPIIRLKENSEIKQISLGYPHLNSRMSVGIEDVKKVYKAMKTFYTALYKKENLVSFKLHPGEAVCIDNTRILHGRSKFTIPQGCQTPRHVQGIYMDWDEIYSRMRGIRPIHVY